MELFIDRLEKLLKEKHVSQKELAEKIGFRRTTISDWKKNGAIPPTDISLKIADYLGTSVEWLVTGESREAPALTDSEREVIENMRDMDERGIAEMVEISRIKRAS